MVQPGNGRTGRRGCMYLNVRHIPIPAVKTQQLLTLKCYQVGD